MSYSVTGAGVQGPVPNTPDVINSIMSMMNPFDQHHYAVVGGGSPASEDSSGSTCSAASPPLLLQPARTHNAAGGSSLKIKESLKMAIRSKQRNTVAVYAAAATNTGCGTAVNAPCAAVNGGVAIVGATASSAGSSAASSPDGGGQAKRRRTDRESLHGGEYEDDDDVSSHGEGLTAEDEERRRRRRDRNKIAATKCRQKKREMTSNLMQESEVLATKNDDLKTEIQKLESQRDDLMKMLTTHPCARSNPHQHQLPRQQHHQQQQQHQQHQQHQQQHHHQEQYATDPYANDPYQHQHHQHHHHVAAEPPILKDAMFNGDAGGYASTATTAYLHHRPATETAAVHYPVVGGVGNGGVGSAGGVYATCVDDLYGYNKDLLQATGGPPDLSHQYYDQGIC